MITGMRSSARSSRSRSKPEPSGSMTSRSTRSGRWLRVISSPVASEPAVSAVGALAGEGFRQRNRDRLLVFDQQHHPRLGVHALIVGGLGRCLWRFSRLRRGRGHGLHRRDRCCRRSRGRCCRRSRGRCCRRSRGRCCRPGSAAGAGSRRRAARATATVPSAMVMTDAVLTPGDLARRRRGGRGAARIVRVLGLVTGAGDVLGGPGGSDGGRGARRRAREGQRVVGNGQRRGRASHEDRGRGEGEEQEPHG